MKRLLALLACCLLGMLHVSATPVPAFSLDSLLKSAHLIAVVQPLDAQGRCEVLAVYAGEAADIGDRIRLEPASGQLGLGEAGYSEALAAKQPVCLFLTEVPTGKARFTLANPYYGGFRVGTTRPEGELSGVPALEAELLLALRAHDVVVVDGAILWLGRVKSERAQAEILGLAGEKKPAPPIVAYALAQSVRTGKKAALLQGIDFIKACDQQNIADTRAKQTTLLHHRRAWKWQVLNAFACIKQAEDMAFMHQLLLHPESGVTGPLAACASDWASAGSIPTLVTVMANLEKTPKPDGHTRQVQYDCLRALCKLTGKPGPSFPDFQKTPAKFVANWQAYVAKHVKAPTAEKPFEEKPATEKPAPPKP